MKKQGITHTIILEENNMFEEIKQHNMLVRDQIYKGFVGGEQLLEKAHQVGDVHPNGKWVWTQLPSGKFDWRTKKSDGQGSTNKQASSETKQSGNKLIDYDENEYKRQQGMAAKANNESLNFGLSVVKTNLSDKEKELNEVQSKRPGAKATIAKLEGEVRYFKGQKKALEEEIEKRGLQKPIPKPDDAEPDPRTDNYKTASEKTGERNPGRANYGWKNSAAGYDARELDDEEE